jgi:sirohydrochlorin ferrochelatase
MIRTAGRISAAGIAPFASAGFITGCRPGFHEALENCLASGATEVIVQPYAVIEDGPIRRDLRRLVLVAREAHPHITIRLARPFGDHPALAQLALQRAIEADYATAHGIGDLISHSAHGHALRRPPSKLHARWPGAQSDPDSGDHWQPLFQNHPTGLLLVAHGSAKMSWDWPLNAAAEWIRIHSHFTMVEVGFLSGHAPIAEATIAQMAARGLHYLAIVPFMLQLTANDTLALKDLVAQAAERSPTLSILLADHLNYDRRMLQVIADRVEETVSANPKRRFKLS